MRSPSSSGIWRSVGACAWRADWHSETLAAILVELARADLVHGEPGPTVERAVAAFRWCGMREALWAADPGRLEFSCGLAISLANLARLLRQQGHLKAAEATYRRAVAMGELLGAANPGRVELGVGLALSLINRGVLLAARGQTEAVRAKAPLPKTRTGPGRVSVARMRHGAFRHHRTKRSRP